MNESQITILTDRQTNIDRQCNSLDILKTICTILIVGSHLLPLIPNKTFNLLYGQWLFRFCVPVFLISSGYFFEGMNENRKKQYIKRILFLYLVSEILFSPFIVIAYIAGNLSILGLLKVFLLGYEHLWYLAAMLYGLLIWYFIHKLGCNLTNRIVTFIAILLLLLGAIFDEYYHLTSCSMIYSIGQIIDKIGSTRSTIFMGLPLMLIGRNIYIHGGCSKWRKLYLWIGIGTFSLLSLIELEIIVSHESIGYMPTCDLTFFNWYQRYLYLLLL